MFLKFLSKRNITSLPADHIELAKIGERQIDIISQEELKRPDLYLKNTMEMIFY